MQVLTVTTFFPNSANRQRSVFVENLVRAMRQRCVVDVVAPMPYAPPIGKRWKAQRAVAARENLDGIEVLHPRFLVIPKFGWLSGISYFVRLVSVLSAWKRSAVRNAKLMVHVHCAYPDAVGAALAARLLGLKYVITAHGSDINIYADRIAYRPQILWALQHADGVIAVSSKIEEKIHGFGKLSAAKLKHIPCAGFDPNVFSPRPRDAARAALNLAPAGRFVVFVGLLVPIKGIEFLIEAWAKLVRRGGVGPQDRLFLLGDGAERAALERQAMQADISRGVRFVGSVRQAEVASWLAAANLLCLPSRNEGTPNVVVEALACGIPVVASRVGGIPELIREGENGMLVAPQNADELAQALERCLARSWEAQKIGASVAHLTWRAIADRNCSFLEAAGA